MDIEVNPNNWMERWYPHSRLNWPIRAGQILAPDCIAGIINEALQILCIKIYIGKEKFHVTVRELKIIRLCQLQRMS